MDSKTQRLKSILFKAVRPMEWIQLRLPISLSLSDHVGMEWEISGDFQHNVFGDSIFLVESPVKNNNSGRVLAAHLFPLATLVSLVAIMMG